MATTAVTPDPSGCCHSGLALSGEGGWAKFGGQKFTAVLSEVAVI